MLDEDFHNKVYFLKENQIEVDMKVNSFASTINDLAENLQTSNDRLNKLNIQLDTLDEAVKDIDEKKLNEKVFDLRIAKFNTIIQQLQKRVNHDEFQLQEFAEFTIRYMPMKLQNQMTTNFLNSVTNCQ